MLTRMLVLCAGGAAVSAGGAATAGAMIAPDPAGPTTTAFLCYSKYQVDPGAWPLSVPGPAHHDAAQLLGLGYWSPYAEHSVRTSTQLANGWYLICNLPKSAQALVSGELLGQKGNVLPATKLAGRPGYYPIAAA